MGEDVRATRSVLSGSQIVCSNELLVVRVDHSHGQRNHARQWNYHAHSCGTMDWQYTC